MRFENQELTFRCSRRNSRQELLELGGFLSPLEFLELLWTRAESSTEKLLEWRPGESSHSTRESLECSRAPQRKSFKERSNQGKYEIKLLPLFQGPELILKLNLIKCKPRLTETPSLHTDDEEEIDEDGETKPQRSPTFFDYLIHLLTVFWKLLFAFVPPTGKWSSLSERSTFVRLCSLARQISMPEVS